MNSNYIASVPKLKGRENYDEWCFAAESLLVLDGTDKYIKPPAGFEVKPAEDAKTKAKLILTIDPALYVHIRNTETSAALWTKLKTMFDDSGFSRKITLLRHLISIRLESCDSMATYVTQIVETAQRLNGTGFTITDEWVGSLLLAGLSDHYSPMIMAIEHSGIPITADVIKSKLLDMEVSNESEVSGAAFVARNKYYSGNNKPKKNGGSSTLIKKPVTDAITKEVVCYKCKSSGHYRNQCPLLKKTTDKCVFNVVFINGKFNKTEWYVDSGASAHMTVNKNWIKNINLTSCLPEIVVANESKVSVDCSGDVNIISDLECHITIKNVLCVPSLTTNLLSVSELIRNGNNVVFEEKHCYIYDRSDALVAIADLTDGVYKLRLQSPSYVLAAPAVTGSLWHRRLAHINSQDMNKMKNGIVDGLSYEGSFDITKAECTTCCEGKQMRLPFTHVGERSMEACHRIHSDLCGPMEVNSLNGNRYFMLFVDDYTRMTFIYFLKQKSEALSKFKEFKYMVENQQGKKIKIFHTDNGLEYCSKEFESYLKQCGIIHQKTNSYTPEQNGVCERANRTVVEKGKCLLFDAKLGKRFWAEAANTAVYLKNRSIVSGVPKSPYELWHGSKPNLSHIRLFGSNVMVHIPKEKRLKWDKKATQHILVGYGEDVKGYRLYNPAKNTIIISRDVIVMEGETGDIATSKEAIWITDEKTAQHNTEQPEVSVEKESSNSVGESCVSEEKDQHDDCSSDSSVYTDGDDNLNESLPSEVQVQVQELQTSSAPIPVPECVETKRLRKQPERYGCSNLCVSSSGPASEEISVSEALEGSEKEQWRRAMADELQSFEDNDAWELVKKPNDVSIVKCRWVFVKKFDVDNNVRYRARLVAKGFTQKPDCLHLQLYRDPKDRYKKGQTKASLSLQHFLGFESGFTLDKESNTIAIICQDVTVVLAFETRERLIAWQVKVGGQLGSSKEFLVMIGGGGSRKLPAGPARMHLQGRRFALTSGVPPRLLGLWELAHLRRYGVVEGRFCFEGGSHCGKGEGLHMLITDQAQDITDAFDIAAQGTVPRTPAASRKNMGNKTRPSTRLSDFNSTEQSIADTASALYEENFFGEDCGRVSPYWPSDERRLYDDDVEISARPPWTGADHVTLERCNNCLTKLGAISRSSTVALTPGTTFNPAWTMEAVPESSSDNSSNSTEYLTPRAIKKTLEGCQCKDKPPERPPKPARLDQKKPPAPLPVQACACAKTDNYSLNNPKVGPYENYDVPKTTHTDTDHTHSEHYDTPKRIKQALADDLFQVTNSSAPGSLVLKKNCGCILKFASKKQAVIVECNENIQPVECPCQKVTNWANNLISLPYCKRTANEHVNTEVLTHQKSEEMALYATIDVSRKTNRQSAASTDKDNTNECSNEPQFTNYQNIEPKEEEKFEGPYANYENLEFALSLEYYENAKDLLKKAGVTQNELDALSANIDLAVNSMPKKPKLCTKCGHSQNVLNKLYTKKNRNDEYLLMEPTNEPKQEFCSKTLGPNPGYTPMSPNPNWSQSLKHPMHKHRVEIEKSLSIPTLTGTENRISIFGTANINKEAMQKRSSSVDSARLLEDLKEFDSSIGSHATSSSLETLRNMAIENRRTSSPCENEIECYDCCKSSGSENKTSEESSSKEIPHLRNKLMDNAQIKRSSSVPCKSGGNRDSSSSNDSGVSSCSLKHGGQDFNEFEMPLTSGHSRYHYMVHKRMRGNLSNCVHSSLPRKSKSSDPLRDMSMQLHKAAVPAKSSSAEAEVPVLPPKQFKGVMDTHSTSSGTSDMSDYIETLSMSSSHSSSDTPMGMRLSRQPTNTLRPRSGKEYHNIDPMITSMYKNGKDLANYTNIP